MTDYTILSIDTSCDETSAAVTSGFNVLSNVFPSQIEYHKKYGGVVPNLARLLHQERINGVVYLALKRAGKTIHEIDAIAVTYGPGLAIALEVGIKKAIQLAEEFKKPLIKINHMEGHLLSAMAQSKIRNPSLTLPFAKGEVADKPEGFLGFLVSGGHTEIILVHKVGNYERIGQTLDDACGEAYDKCGRILGLGYPAGPIISKISKENRKNFILSTYKTDRNLIAKVQRKSDNKVFELPVPMAYTKDLNMSYSGLKTAFGKLVSEFSNLSKEDTIALAITFEHAALTQLEIKLERALKENKVSTVLLGGGVVASSRLRSVLRKIARKYKAELLYPFAKSLTGDNAAMIGVAANMRMNHFGGVQHKPELGFYLKDFELVDREPNLDF